MAQMRNFYFAEVGHFYYGDTVTLDKTMSNSKNDRKYLIQYEVDKRI